MTTERHVELDLSTCDREPIHIPGSIQPHGLLLVVEPEHLTVCQGAGDSARLAGRSIDSLIGATAEAILGPNAASLIDSARHAVETEPVYLGSIAVRADAVRHDLTSHTRDG